MRAADAALYRAKRNGGGQICTAGLARLRRDRRARSAAPLRRTTQERVRDAVRGADRALRRRARPRGPARAHRGRGRRASRGAQHRRVGDLLRAGRRRPRSTRSRRPTSATSGSRASASASTTRSTRSTSTRRRRGWSKPARAPSWPTSTTDAPIAPSATLLELLGRTGVLAATAADHDADLAAGALRRRAHGAARGGRSSRRRCCCAPAIPPRSARKGAELRERWAPAVGLTNALGARLADETDEQEIVEGGRRGAAPRWCPYATALIRLRVDGRLEHGRRRRGPRAGADAERLARARRSSAWSGAACASGARAGAGRAREPDYRSTPATPTSAPSWTCRCWSTARPGGR